ncbi:hypothetical protein RHGRI_037928 [Rhododendron griersonianum]|uniref:Uncharacterized protein n=1 Tax=Rhododendron griersonianum TaxID=479676 RepID=A0AAV6HXH7_9ERIC|nr:hypothetical protein RHGRI_037928 [Rhododendron griersonianum]
MNSLPRRFALWYAAKLRLPRSEMLQSVTKWKRKAAFQNHNGIPGGGVRLPSSMAKRKRSAAFQNLDGRTYSTWRTTNFYGMASYSVRYATLINRTLLLLFSRHPNLESVEIMDSKKHGAVSLQGEQLRKLKNNMSELTPPPANISEEAVMMNLDLLPRLFDLWSAAELRLPRSGLAMEGVTLGAGAVNRYPDQYDHIDGLVADFENNGDDIFGEALTQIHASSSFRRQSFSIGISYSGKLQVESYRVPSDMDS